LAKDLEANRRKDEALALEQLKVAQTSHGNKPAKTKPADKKIANKKTPASRKATLKNKEPEFFTATDGAVSKKKARNKNAKP
jgi:hypothetical protein